MDMGKGGGMLEPLLELLLPTPQEREKTTKVLTDHLSLLRTYKAPTLHPFRSDLPLHKSLLFISSHCLVLSESPFRIQDNTTHRFHRKPTNSTRFPHHRYNCSADVLMSLEPEAELPIDSSVSDTAD